MRSAWLESASIDFRSGAFLSSASPVHETKTVGMTSVAPFGAFADIGRARRVPAGVAAGLERGADAARGEARRVGLALHQLLAAEFGDGRAGAGRAQEAVVLLGGQAGHRLEEVGVVGGAVLEGPVLHGAGDRVGDGRVERQPLLDRLLQRLEDRLRQPGLLDFLTENQLAEEVLDVRGAEVDLIEIVLGVRDGFDRLLSGCGHARRLQGC